MQFGQAQWYQFISAPLSISWEAGHYRHLKLTHSHAWSLGWEDEQLGSFDISVSLWSLQHDNFRVIRLLCQLSALKST